MDAATALTKNITDDHCWREFKPGNWCETIDVRDFIVRNVTRYLGDEQFLAGPSERTKAVWEKLQPYFQDGERKAFLPSMPRHRRRCWRTRLDI